MASPVQNSSTAATQQQPVQAMQKPVPRGVGDAPTNIQSQQPQVPEKKEKGYVERAVHAVRDFIVWLLDSICCCFRRKKEEPPPPVQNKEAPEQPPTKEPSPTDPQTQRLLDAWPRMLLDEDILQGFEAAFPSSTKERVYLEIGKTAPRSWRHLMCQSYSRIGKAMVEERPRLLLGYIFPRVAQGRYKVDSQPPATR